MADQDEEKCDAETLLIQRHKKERKDLQGEIQKMKHGISKGDKKKKKDVTEKIAIMEADLDARQEKELGEVKQNPTQEATVASGINQVTEAVADLTTQDQGNTVKQKKPSKAQKRREKKAAGDQEREERIREQEIENLTSSRHLEAVKIGSALSQRGLQIHEIPSDGDCLYAAVAHQLGQRKISSSTSSLREQVGEHMRSNAGDFMPFLTKDNGDCYTEEDYEKYCAELETTPAWGGQLEIQALSSVLKSPVEVIQSEGPPIVTGEHFNGPPLVLTYYRHAYGLGEHYHSVEEKTEETEDDFT